LRKGKTPPPPVVGTPRLSDVAKRVGVSPGLVSRLLNGDPQLTVREETRRRVLEAVEELGYVPNSAARALRQARVGALGLVVYRISNPIYSELIEGAQSAAGDHGYAILLGNSAGAEDSAYLSTILNSGRIDGLLLQHGYGELDVDLSALPSEVPIVLLNSEGHGRFTGVRLDESRAVDLLVEHLAGLGHRRVAYIAGDRSGALSRRREQAVRERLGAAGVQLPEDYVVGSGWEAEDGIRALGSLAQLSPRPTAVIVANSNVALGVLTAARQLGIAVPSELSVCALHDSWITEHVFPALTCATLPMRDLGVQAVLSLIDALDRKAPAQSVMVDAGAPRLVVRSSTSRAMER
jgi:LacI family transcriptional regulator